MAILCSYKTLFHSLCQLFIACKSHPKSYRRKTAVIYYFSQFCCLAGCFWLSHGATLNSSVDWAPGSNMASHIVCQLRHVSSPPCASHLPVGWAYLLMAISGEQPTAKLEAIKFLATEVREIA